jgi:hypothetical protein
VILNKGKERAAVGKLLKLHREMYPDQDSTTTIQNLRVFFDACNLINDPWLQENMSLSIIVSKFNEINKKLRNGNQRPSSKGGATDAELAAVVFKHFGQ